MSHTPSPELGGHLRPSWVHIGGVLGGYPPPAYVAAPAEEVPGLLEDLLEYIDTTSHHPVIAAAVAHVQFESIHPFRDGNGETGRALVQTILRQGGITRFTTPPISAILALNRDGYINALITSRFKGEAGTAAHAESLDPWVSLFSSAAEASCDDAEGLLGRIDAVVSKWDQKLRSRRGHPIATPKTDPARSRTSPRHVHLLGPRSNEGPQPPFPPTPRNPPDTMTTSTAGHGDTVRIRRGLPHVVPLLVLQAHGRCTGGDEGMA